MSPALERLLSVSSAPLLSEPPALDESIRSSVGRISRELDELLGKRNGFYVFESALHVFPSGASGCERSLESWNDRALWVSAYEGLADGFLFFAEDIFGAQFALRDNEVWSFDPETGQGEAMAASMAAWAELLIKDYDVLTGYPIAHQWQSQHGTLVSGHRLVPKTPFVLGGEFDLANLHSMDAVRGMLFRADIAVQIRDLPDGAQVKLQVVE